MSGSAVEVVDGVQNVMMLRTPKTASLRERCVGSFGIRDAGAGR